MTWWMIVLLVFAVLFLIGCIPLGLDAQYQEGTFLLRAKIGPFWLSRITRRKKRKGTAAAEEKPDAPAKKTLLTLPAGSASETWELLRFLSAVLGDLPVSYTHLFRCVSADYVNFKPEKVMD